LLVLFPAAPRMTCQWCTT